MGVIYKIDNLINNKCYIGKTSRSLEERFLNKNGGSNIRACCRGKLKTAYGYKWKYKEVEKAGG